MAKISVSICATLAAFCLISAAVAAPPKRAFVRVIEMKSDATIREGFTQNTSLEALERVVLYPRVTGRLQKMSVAKGQQVKKGQQIAVLAHDEQNAQVNAAQAAVERTRAEWSNAQIELQRYKRLKNEGFSTQQLLDSKDTAFRSAKAQYDAARSDLTRLTVTRNEYFINASIDGTVLNDYSLVPGAMLSANTPVAELANLKTLKAIFRVPESRFYSVKPGMSVLLTLDALPKDQFRAQIVRVDDYVDPQSRTAGVEARIQNETTGNRLRPGMFGRAYIIEKEELSAYVVPLGALRKPRTDSNENELALYDNGKIKLVKVKTGIVQGVTIEIKEGLSDGDQVVTFGGNALKDGDEAQLM
jgi:RND family efflux transporter MFP subunit